MMHDLRCMKVEHSPHKSDIINHTLIPLFLIELSFSIWIFIPSGAEGLNSSFVKITFAAIFKNDAKKWLETEHSP